MIWIGGKSGERETGKGKKSLRVFCFFFRENKKEKEVKRERNKTERERFDLERAFYLFFISKY